MHAVSLYETLPPKANYRQVLPAEITPQKSLTAKVHTGPKPMTGRCVIRVGLDKSDDLATVKLTARLNGSAAAPWRTCPLLSSPIRGWKYAHERM